MKKFSLLVFSALLLSANTAFAQYQDVTAQYIPNAGFEGCPSLTPNSNGVVIIKISAHNPTDYADYGWKLEGGVGTDYNAGVAEYPLKIQPSWSWVEGPTVDSNGNTGKALCVTGNGVTLYKQSEDIVLPAGQYKLTANIWAYAVEVSHQAPTIDIKQYTGFVANDGTEYMSKSRNANQVVIFESNKWVEDVIEFELTKETKGKIQLGYGTPQFVVIDNLKLEYLGGVVTTALANVVTKAKALNAQLNNNDLTTAISAAEAFITNPTTQDDVATEVEKMYNAMSAALATATQPIDISSAYIDNPSFETGSFGEWEYTRGEVNEISDGALVTPRCDGVKYAEFASTSSLTQNISHLPAGFYLVSAKVSGRANLTLGTTSSSVTGGTYNSNAPLFLRVYTPAASFEEGNIAIGSSGTGSYKIDDFHLYYAKDAASLESLALATVKADASAIIAESQYNNITGEERGETVTAIEGSDYAAINTKVNTFVHVKTSYDDFVAAQTKAAPYTADNYPYADKTMLETVKTICGTTAQSSTLAKEMTTQLNTVIAAIPFSNAYCEGIAEKVDYTSKIVGADATGSTVTGWTVNNIQILPLANSKVRPVKDQGTSDKTVYGTPDSYTSGTSSIQQTINNLPAGTYVLSVSIMASTHLPIAVRINNDKKNTFIGKGTAASSSWNEVVTEFDLDEAGNVTIRLEEGADSGTKLWYCDNFRLYSISNGGGETSILSLRNGMTTNNIFFDLSGHSVVQPTKGLYIVNGKKVMVK